MHRPTLLSWLRVSLLQKGVLLRQSLWIGVLAIVHISEGEEAADGLERRSQLAQATCQPGRQRQ